MTWYDCQANEVSRAAALRKSEFCQVGFARLRCYVAVDRTIIQAVDEAGGGHLAASIELMIEG